MRTTTTFLLLASSLLAQQPNDPRAELCVQYGTNFVSGSNTSTAAGPNVWQMPSTGAQFCYLWICGINGQYYEVWGHSGALAINATTTECGIVDLDLTASWTQLVAASLNNTWPGGTWPPACGITCYQNCAIYASYFPQAPSATSLQGFVTDPTAADGCRFTAAVYLWN